MIQFLIDKINDGEIPEEKLKFVDLGTGNGHLLFEMYEEFEQELNQPVECHFTGIDYSPESIEFADKINHRKYQEQNFDFKQVDLLDPQNEFLQKNLQQFDILLDKGTLDAIALNQDPLEAFDGKIGMEVYAHQIKRLMHSGSILLITSCNFTEDELIKIITQDTDLKVWDKIEYPSFEFGGAKGSTICSLAFKRD